MDTSQKHLNNIKSIFGGIKNWWNKGKDETPKEEEERTGPRSERWLQCSDPSIPIFHIFPINFIGNL